MAKRKRRRGSRVSARSAGARPSRSRSKPRKKAVSKRRKAPARPRKVAPRKPLRRKPREARWYQDFGREQAIASTLRQIERGELLPESFERSVTVKRKLARSRVLVAIREDIKNLRRFFTGFETEDGYDIRHPERWTWQRKEQARAYSDYLRNLQSTPHLLVTPKSRAMERALRTHTGQYSKRQKAFVFHTEKPDTTQVRFVEGRLEEQRKVTGMTLIKRYYFFVETLDYQPATFDEMVTATRRMLPSMPRGYYVLHTKPHGPIGAATPKENILSLLRRYEYQYEQQTPEQHEGFAEAILGYEYLGTDSEIADEEFLQRQARRTQATMQKAQNKSLKRKRAAFLRRMGRIK